MSIHEGIRTGKDCTEISVKYSRRWSVSITYLVISEIKIKTDPQIKERTMRGEVHAGKSF